MYFKAQKAFIPFVVGCYDFNNGALSMDVDVPDVEESLSLLERIIKIIRDIFDMIASWFKK